MVEDVIKRAGRVEKTTINKVERFKRQMKVNSSEDNLIQLFHIIRKLLSYTFKLNYEFTYEELKREVRKKRMKNEERERIIKFANKLEKFEYNPPDNKRVFLTEIKKISNEFENIIKEIYEEKEEEREQRVKTRLFKKNPMRRIALKFSAVTRKNKKKKRNKNESKDKKKNTEDIYSILLKANESLDSGNYDDVKKLYNEIRAVYNKLNDEDKKKVYADVIMLYKRLMKSTGSQGN